MHYAALPFILDIHFIFLYVGLCSLLFFYFQDTWNYVMRWIRARGLSRVDAVDFGSKGSSSMHVPQIGFK